MSVDYMLLRVTSNQKIETMTKLLPFGSQQEVINRLCYVLGFERDTWEDEHVQLEIEKWMRSQGHLKPEDKKPSRATMLYKYHHKNDNGRIVSYSLQGDPVASFHINRAYPEDFLPVIEVLRHLEPFSIMGPQGHIDPESLFYTVDDWVQKNYEEEYPLSYDG